MATTPICTRLISSACSKPNSPTGVYVYCVILSTIGYYLNWGFGLVFAALICKNLAVQAERKGIAIDYRYLCGAGWTPFFIWHTVADQAVPVENSLLLASALTENHVPYELHLFTHGGHGSSTCTQEVNTPNRHNAAWVSLCTDWLAETLHFHL